ncbi:hypothetical protein [Pseudomarimonas salicorniae]|uniref:Lipoprotein n=1 Tax=Pseudomarimonas salicorniae TaxID=2933270 RepID=A0ABT0GMI0_9GAMM|nr:hypothetical protein [Lysobacter sp. CAU 1642]MCK7595577.1 hypothetical protein [Lysobacter sp. CAU 1642]
MSPTRILLLCAALLAAGCVDREAQQRERAAQMQARAEAAAREGAAQVDAVIRDGKIEIAHAYAVDVVSRYGNTEAGRALAARLPELEKQAGAIAEARRLDNLWTYHKVDDAEAGGMVYTAYIHGVSRGAGSAPQVRLVIRRHPSWGQSIYLLMDSGGDFACNDECRIPLTVDDGEPRQILISRAKDNVPPAVFIEEDRKVLPIIEKARRLTIDLPLAGGSSRDFVFEVSALKMDELGPPPKGK